MFVQSWLMAWLVHLGVAAIVVLRALLDVEDAGDTIFRHPSTLVGAEFVMAGCVGAKFVWVGFKRGRL